MDHLLLLLLLWSSGLRGGGSLASAAAARCEAAKADIMMLVDESVSISFQDFRIILQSVAEMINTFSIGPDTVQIGLTLFADNPRPMWNLNTYQNKQSLLKAVDSLNQIGGSTYTGLALEHVLRHSFKHNVGMRPDSRKILLVFTDGESVDDVQLPAEHLRATGIEVYAIGIADASHSQMVEMTADPTHVYYVEDFSSLLETVNHLTNNLCNSITSRAAARCEAAKADIMMLVDESGSISFQDFRIILQSVAEMINTFSIGPDTVQIGLTLFADNPRLTCNLNTYQNKQSLLKAVDSLNQIGGSTYTGLALEHVLRHSFKHNVGMRPDSRKILLVFTDGESVDDVQLPAEHLRATGIEVYAIGIEYASHSQMVEMTADPTHVYYVADFSSLLETVNHLTNNLCNSITSRDPVRLVNGTSLCSGRLEVMFDHFNHCNQSNQSNQYNQGWSSVCETDFDLRDAEVVCRELGCGDPSVLQGALYGEVEAPWWTKEFQCEGRESALMCCRSSASDRNSCSPGRAAGLTCSEPLRLVGGASRCAGALQVRLREWRMVDASDWSLKAAAAACGELHCGSAVLTRATNESSESRVWSIDCDCVEAGWRLRECSKSCQSSSIVELVCSDLLEQPIISVSSVGGVSNALQQGYQVSWGSSFTLSCSTQPQYPGGSFQLSFTSSNITLSHTQPAVNHFADFLFPAAGHAHQGSYTCVYHVHMFSHNFSSESRRLSLVVSDPTVFFVRLLLLLLSLLLFTSLICFSHKTAGGQKKSPQKDVEVEQLQSLRRRRIIHVELQ